MRIVKTTGFSLLATAMLFSAGPALAGMIAPPATSVPTLGEWGLAGIAALLAVAAGRALHSRKR
jgi:hypothetical protein